MPVSAGCPAARLRALLRTFAAWSPMLLVLAALVVFHGPVNLLGRSARPVDPVVELLRYTVVAAAVAILIAGLIAAIRLPERGLHDRLAGTWLVPR